MAAIQPGAPDSQSLGPGASGPSLHDLSASSFPLPWFPSAPAPPQVFLTATHSHGSPFDILEGYVCPVLFGTAWGGDQHHDNHGAAHGGPQHCPPTKAKEELGESSRKKKTKKAD